MSAKQNLSHKGQESYKKWVKDLRSSPTYQKIYDEEAKKSALWLQLVEARQEVGLTQTEVAKRMGVSQAQVARIEKRGYYTYTLQTIRRYLAALGGQFSLEIAIQRQNYHASIQ